jgi:hypothetical protein
MECSRADKSRYYCSHCDVAYTLQTCVRHMETNFDFEKLVWRKTVNGMPEEPADLLIDSAYIVIQTQLRRKQQAIVHESIQDNNLELEMEMPSPQSGSFSSPFSSSPAQANGVMDVDGIPPLSLSSGPVPPDNGDVGVRVSQSSSLFSFGSAPPANGGMGGDPPPSPSSDPAQDNGGMDPRVCENDGVKIMSGLCECPHWEHTDSLEPNARKSKKQRKSGG